MKIVKLWGGLGNQMFEYAFGLSLSEYGHTVRYDKAWLKDYQDYLGENNLEDVFSVSPEEASEEEIRRAKYGKRDLFHRAGRRLGLLRNTYIVEEKDNRGDYQQKVLTEPNDCYLEGYWQEEGYFQECKDKVLAAFTFRRTVNEKSQVFYRMIINDDTSVSVHVRLGDYEKPENKSFFGGICTLEYYNRAISHIEKKIGNPHFYLFSNEPQKALEMMGSRNCHVINCNSEQEGWNDMLLMSTCRHHIIANSSFSWWGAYLNRNPQKTVIAPRKWCNEIEWEQLHVDGWVRL